MRRKLASAAEVGGDEDGGPASVSAVAATKKFPVERAEPLTNDPPTESGDGDGSTDELSDSALSTSSLLDRGFSEEYALSSSSSTTGGVRLGGCADPAVVAGSITDPRFVDRKASVVGNTRLDAYGGTGGGYLERCDRSRDGKRRRSSSNGAELMSFDGFDMDVLDNNDSNNNNGNADPVKLVLKWEVGASSECGVRNSNEDSYVAINDLENLILGQKGMTSFSQQELTADKVRQQGLYAIFDGHVGNQAAR